MRKDTAYHKKLHYARKGAASEVFFETTREGAGQASISQTLSSREFKKSMYGISLPQ
jgi:hypothetical protein